MTTVTRQQLIEAADRFPLRDAQRQVADLLKPNLRRYFTDTGLTAAAGWSALAVLTLAGHPVAKVLAWALATYLLYRGYGRNTAETDIAELAKCGTVGLTSTNRFHRVASGQQHSRVPLSGFDCVCSRNNARGPFQPYSVLTPLRSSGGPGHQRGSR